MRFRKPKSAPERPIMGHDATSIEEARAARKQSEQGLAEAVSREGTVRHVANSLRALRHENHFASAIEAVFGGNE
jgi:hypothetical protein